MVLWFALGDPSAFKAASYEPSFAEPAVGVVLYAAGVWGLKQLMRNREPMTLKAMSIVHNIVLIVLSLAMGIGAFQGLQERYGLEGFDGLFCCQRSMATTLDGIVGFWMKIYYLSKYYEFGDTVILILKKKDTIPLHLYHHASMVVLTWSWCRFGWLEGSLWCVFVNSFIHVYMYVYYLVATLGYHPWWRRYVTRCQIVQFCTGFVYVCIFLHQSFTRGCGASAKVWVALPTHFVNVSFIALFALFYKTDKKKTNGKKTVAKSE